MELLLPALIVFLLAFTGLSVGIIFGRKGITGSCSSNETKLLDIECFCGRGDNCDESCPASIAVTAVCADGDFEKCRQIQADFEKQAGSSSPPK